MTTEDEARALIERECRIADAQMRKWVKLPVRYVRAVLASRVSTPPSEEPVAWAIRGRKTGRIREVTTYEDYADECRRYYDVIPLVASVPATPPTEPEEKK